MKAMSWSVEIHNLSGKAFGQFRLAFGASCVTIHTLGAVCTDPDKEYIEKLEIVIKALRDFSSAISKKNRIAFREWLNPLDTSATGSVAYHYNTTSKEEPIVYFELASCDNKIRIYPYHFPSPQLSNMRKCLDSMAIEISNHKHTFTRLVGELDSVNIE